MAVDQDDSFYDSASDSDDDQQYETDNEHDMLDCENQVDNIQMAVASSHKDKEIQYHQEKMKKIYGEMRERICQLHELMSKGGLTESAEILEKCFDTKTGKPKG